MDWTWKCPFPFHSQYDNVKSKSVFAAVTAVFMLFFVNVVYFVVVLVIDALTLAYLIWAFQILAFGALTVSFNCINENPKGTFLNYEFWKLILTIENNL